MDDLGDNIISININYILVNLGYVHGKTFIDYIKKKYIVHTKRRSYYPPKLSTAIHDKLIDL